MPDITKCEQQDCKLKETCYRFKAKSNRLQSYFMGDPRNEDKTCDYYWELKPEQKK